MQCHTYGEFHLETQPVNAIDAKETSKIRYNTSKLIAPVVINPSTLAFTSLAGVIMMVLPCSTISRFIAAHAVHPALRAARHGFVHVRRHVAHHIQRATHAVASHQGLWVDTACRVAPGAFAVGLLALSPAANGTGETVFQPAMTVVQLSTDSMTNIVPTVMAPLLNAAIPTLDASSVADLGPAPISASADDASADLLRSAIITGDVAPQADHGLPSSKLLDQPPLLATTATSVPEPSSLLMFASALCGLSVLVHGRNRRKGALRNAPCGTDHAVD